MKIVDNILYIEFSEMLQAGFKESYLKKAKSTGTKCWHFMDDPTDKRRVLVGYDKLRQEYKDKIQRTFGNPYDYIAKQPIRAMLQRDVKAEEFFISQKLPLENVTRYTNEATWLNMLLAADSNKAFIKKQGLNLSMEAFYEHVGQLIKMDREAGRVTGIFPTDYRKLRAKMADYKENGYASLIDKRFGNKSAAKISDELATDTLKAMLGDGLQFDDVFICYQYNAWAEKNGYKTIQPGIVGHWRRQWESELTASRHGWGAFNEKFIRQVKGLPANTMHPLAFVECDDYNLNYYYQDAANKKELKRYVSYIVADSCLGLVLGSCYRMASAPTFDMVQVAWLDAMYYIRHLAGDGHWYLPMEVKADHWNKQTAFPYFKGIANFVPPAVANKHRGYIEQLFGSPHAKRAEKLAAIDDRNYNGNNLTAANRGVNMEMLNSRLKNRPQTGDEAAAQVDRYFYLMRTMPAITRDDMQAQSREAQWLERWQKLAPEQKRPITETQFLLRFGIRGRNITISNRGAEPVISGVKYSYDLPDYVNMQHLIGEQVQVVYDPYDMSRVLLTNNNDLYFVAKHATLQPRALAYAYGGSRESLNRILAEKKAQVKAVGGKLEKLKQGYDDKALLMGGLMPKEEYAMIENGVRQQQAEEADNWEAERLEFKKKRSNLRAYLQ